MGVICSSCGRDIDALGQDNMSCTSEPLCEDCFSDRLGHAAPMARSLVERERERLAVRDELDRLRRENEALKRDPVTPAQALAHARELAEDAYAECPERRAALERLEECAMWMGRCRPRETAAPAHGEAAAGAAQPVDLDVRPDLDAALASWDPHGVHAQAHAEIGGGVMARGDVDGCMAAAENLMELLEALPDSLHRDLAIWAVEECEIWLEKMEGEDE